MADNYLENQYEAYQKRKALWEAKKKYSRDAIHCVRKNGQTDHETLHELHVLIRANDRPYNPFRKFLYTPASLYEGYQLGHPESYNECFDNKVYQHYLSYGKKTTQIEETLARTLHDHAITDALNDFLAGYDEKRVVGIMGGHGLLRTDDVFRKVALLSKRLTEAGFLMVSGGGPGAMEATHLGAWMAGREEEALDDALRMLSVAPIYKDRLWLDSALQVMTKYPHQIGRLDDWTIDNSQSTHQIGRLDDWTIGRLDNQIVNRKSSNRKLTYKSLGIPTWLYGHEPSTPFATHIAKYFENALREDGLLTIAGGGIVYSPGSAGTLQEIFQEAVQNHYLSFGYSSPMIFFGREYWTEEMPVYLLLDHLLKKGKYKNLLLTLTDEIDEILRVLSAENS